MPDKNELIRKAQEKVARPVFKPGQNLQAVKDKLKNMGKAPVRPAETKTQSLIPRIPVSTPASSPALEAPLGIKNPERTSPSKTTSLDGILTLDDLKAKKYNPYMIYQVPIEWIDFEDSETYNRDPFETMKTTRSFLNLVEDIKEFGQKIPGIVRVNKYGLLKVTDGWRRALASRESGNGVYLCTISDESDQEAAINALRLNLLREDLPEYNKLLEIRKLNEKHNLTYEVISKRIGFGDKVYISNCLAIFKVPAVEEALKNKQVSISTGRHLAKKAISDKLTDPEVKKMVVMVVRQEVKLKDLKFLDMKVDKPKQKAPTAPAFKPRADGSFNYPAIRFKPTTMAIREVEKTIGHLESIIKILRKDIRDRQK